MSCGCCPGSVPAQLTQPHFFFINPGERHIQLFVGFFFLYLFTGLHQIFIAACGIWFPDRGSHLGPLKLGAWSLNRWTSRKVFSD